MKSLPTISSYGKYDSDNYGAHSLRVSIGGLDVYFSYSTPVAFRAPGQLLIVRENEWGPTTGKHLNWIDGGDKTAKKARLPGREFEEHLRAMVEEIGDIAALSV